MNQQTEPKFHKTSDNFFNFNKRYISTSVDKDKNKTIGKTIYESDNKINEKLNDKFNTLLVEYKNLEKEEKNDLENNKERENLLTDNNNDNIDLEDLYIFNNIANILNSNNYEDEDKDIDTDKIKNPNNLTRKIMLILLIRIILI